MIKSLQIENYQSHKKSFIEFSPNLTAFTGLNNHGKSVIFRALKKIMRNKPVGASFVSDWANTCLITLETDKGTVVRKVRSVTATDANMYTINEGEEYANFGREIPDAVLAYLGISQPQVFSDVELDINFQSQLDPMFLVQGDALPSLRGKVLSRITGVDVAQRGIQRSAALEKNNVKYINQYEASLKELLGELEQYNNVEELELSIICIDTGIKERDKSQAIRDDLAERLQSLKSSVAGAKLLHKKIEDLTFDFITLINRVNEKKVILDRLGSAKDTISSLSQVKEFITSCRHYDFTHLRTLLEIQNRLQRVVVIQKQTNVIASIVLYDIPDIKRSKEKILILEKLKTLNDVLNKWRTSSAKVKVCKDLERLQNQIILTKRMQEVSASLQSKDNFIINIKPAIEASEKELIIVNEAIETTKKELGICPTCGRAF